MLWVSVRQGMGRGGMGVWLCKSQLGKQYALVETQYRAISSR